MCSVICALSESEETWYFNPNCNECANDFLLRVNLRRHIRSGPPKPAPTTCYDHYLVVSSYNIQTYRSEHKCLVEPKFSIHTEHLVHLTGSQLYKFLVAVEFCSPLQKVWIISMMYFIIYFLDSCLSSCPGCSGWNISTYLFTSWLPGSAQLVGWYCCLHGYRGL